MNDERMKILEMIQHGKLTANEGLELFKALEDADKKSGEMINTSSRFLRIRITSGLSTKVNVNIPLSLLKLATKFADVGMKFIPEDARQEMQKKGINLSDINFAELAQLIEQGLVDGKLADIETEDEHSGRTKVDIYVE